MLPKGKDRYVGLLSVRFRECVDLRLGLWKTSEGCEHLELLVYSHQRGVAPSRQLDTLRERKGNDSVRRRQPMLRRRQYHTRGSRVTVVYDVLFLDRPEVA